MAKVELKQPIVQEIAETVKDAQSAVLVQYLGLTVEQDTALRKELREAGVIYKVYKKPLMRRAFEGTEFESLSKHLDGPNALAVSKDDAVKPASILAKYVSAHKCFNFVGGGVEGEYVDSAKLDEIEKIQTRAIILDRLFGSMQSPVTNVARVIKQIAEKDGEAPAAEEAAPAAE